MNIIRFVCVLILFAITSFASADDTTVSDTETRPGPPPGSYEIHPASNSICIPFEMFHSDIRMVGSINGKEVRMLIDNGSLWDQLLFFGSERVDELGLKRDGEVEVGGSGTGEVVLSDVAEGITLGFKGADDRTITFYDQVGIITSYDPDMPNPWAGSEGQVSANFFKHFVVDVDFDKGRMTLIKPEAFDPAGRGVEIPIRPLPDSGSWTLPGIITLDDGRRLELDMTMDLGWGKPLGITTGRKHNIQAPADLERICIGIGAQGEIFGYFGQVRSLEIGGYRFEEVSATYASREDGGSDVDEILVGMGIYRRFHIVYDYPNHRIFVKPNSSFDKPF